MDPDVLLEELLALARDIRWHEEATADDMGVTRTQADELAEKILDLDIWLLCGGAMPTRWT
jgi:hypothetical protein